MRPASTFFNIQLSNSRAGEIYSKYIENNKVPVAEHAQFWQHYEDNISSGVDFVNI